MSDHDATQRAIGRLSDRITDTKQEAAEQVDKLGHRLSERLEQVIEKLDDGHTERQEIIGELSEVKRRLEVVEKGQTNSSTYAAAHAATVAKQAVKDAAPAVAKETAATFWDRSKSKALLWFAGTAAGGAIASLDDIARFLERLWAAAKGGPLMTDDKRLSPGDIAGAAKLYGLSPAHIRAVLTVESAGKGFADDGRPIVRFEPHWFRRLTDERFDKSHPYLSHAYSVRKRYRQPVEQADRWTDQLEPALALDRDAAIQATSWGLGQLMGFNYRRCGFLTPQKFLNAHWENEAGQLDAMLRFIANAGLMDELRDRRWAAFAYSYNGEDFASNRYDKRLADAYRAAA